MKSLHLAKRKQTGSVKIDHFIGDLSYDYTNGDWDHCTAGVNAKDVTDCIAGNIHLMGLYSNEFIPYQKWEKEIAGQRTIDIVKMKNTEILNKLHLF